MTVQLPERWIPAEAREDMVLYTAMACDPHRGPQFEDIQYYLESVGDDHLEAATQLVSLGDELQHTDKHIMRFISTLICANTPVLMLAMSEYFDLVRSNKVSLHRLTDLVGALMEADILPSPSGAYVPLEPHLKVMKGTGRFFTSSYCRDIELIRVVHENSDRCDDIIKLSQEDNITSGGLLREHLHNASPALSDGLL